MIRAFLLAAALFAGAGCVTAPPDAGLAPPALDAEAVDEPPQLVGGLRGLLARVSVPRRDGRRRPTGEVVVAAVVDVEGRVVWTGIERSAGPTLDRAVTEAVRASTFVPAILDGEPVQARVAIPFSFSMSPRPGR